MRNAIDEILDDIQFAKRIGISFGKYILETMIRVILFLTLPLWVIPYLFSVKKKESIDP